MKKLDNEEICDYMHIHEEIVDKVNENMPSEEMLFDLAKFLKVFMLILTFF